MTKKKGIWYDTPIENRPVCPTCNRHRHGNQRHLYPVEFIGFICSRCFNQYMKPKNNDKGWYLDKILQLNPDFEVEEFATHKGGLLDNILTSTRFPYVLGQRIHLDEYFLRHNYFDLVEPPH